MTKKELLAQLEEQNEINRRLQRAVNQMSLDTPEVTISSARSLIRAYPTDHSRQAIKRALAQWELDVTEPECGGDWHPINAYIKSMDGIGWTWEDDYVRNGQFAWCGAFAAFAYGPRFSFGIRKKIMPSCYRLMSNWSSTPRHRDPDEIMTGDIVVVWTSDKQTPAQGNHIVLALTSPDDDGSFDTVEGNAKGNGPDGRWREGVSTRTRNIKDVAHVYRPLSEDFS